MWLLTIVSLGRLATSSDKLGLVSANNGSCHHYQVQSAKDVDVMIVIV